MKRLVLILLAVMFVAGARAETHFVRMLNGPFRFDPATLTVNVGDTVIWTNRTTTPHDTVCEGVWASPLFGFRGSFAVTFNEGGKSFNYVCTPHIDAGMVGTITVLGGAVNNAPTAAITSPGNGASFLTTDTVTVVVNANDEARVASVRLFLDVDFVVGTKTSPPFEFTVSGLSPGSHSLRALATDEQGLTGASEEITINVAQPNQPPGVELTTPSNGGTFTAPVTLTLEANATDDAGVQAVEFFVNDFPVGSDSTGPFSIGRTFTAGTYRLRARATDAEGLSGNSAEITIVVNNPSPSAPVVQIISPTANMFVAYITNMSVQLTATASDADGNVAKVEFFEGINSLGVATRAHPPETVEPLRKFPAAPDSPGTFMLFWLATEGRHTITAKATDNLGNVATSNPVSFTVALRPLLTSTKLVETNGAVRISIFGTSGVPFVFERSEDGATWTPFLTNQLYRRILFFDDRTAGGRTNRMYRARNP